MDKTRDDQTTLTLARDLEDAIGTEALESLSETVVGAPITVPYATQSGQHLHVNFNDLQIVAMAHRISRLWSSTRDLPPRNILEIGGGYGGLAVKLIRLWSKCHYVIIDLPEASLLQDFYVHECTGLQPSYGAMDSHPNASIGSIHLLDVSEADLLDSTTWDLIINTRSMQEMDPRVIQEYFTRIQRDLCVGGIFYNLNRFVTGSTGLPNCVARYPYDDRWRLISATPFPTQWVQLEIATQRIERPDPTGQRFIRALPTNYLWRDGISSITRHPLQVLDQILASYASIIWLPVKRLSRLVRLVWQRRTPDNRTQPAPLREPVAGE
jgi:putative sugar O-methyltransferase